MATRPSNLNTLVAPSAAQLTSAIPINDARDIIAEGTLNGDQLDFVLAPNHN